MVKAPSSHGLDRKYKPWRRGKSVKATGNKLSLKQQLRGMQRLYQKKYTEKESSMESNSADTLQQQELLSKIETLQQQIQNKGGMERERTNARASHKMRFVERQKTTRLYTQLTTSTIHKEKELFKLALDQVYIAHYPHNHSSYLSLYTTTSNNNRDNDNNNTNSGSHRRKYTNRRLLQKMATQRQRVLEQLANTTSEKEDRVERVSWIPVDQYERIAAVKTWSMELERTTFDMILTDDKNTSTSTESGGMDNNKNNTVGLTKQQQNHNQSFNKVTDQRFANVTTAAQQLVKQQEEIERSLEQEEQKVKEQKTYASYNSKSLLHSQEDEDNNDSSSTKNEYSSDDNENDETDPLVTICENAPMKNYDLSKRSASSGSEDQDTKRKDTSTDALDDDDNDAVSSSSSSDDDDDDDDDESSSCSESDQSQNVADVTQSVKTPTTALLKSTREEVVAVVPPIPPPNDAFLVAPADNDDNVFANARHQKPSLDDAKGDKSKGWATQRQFPGQFRKKQKRR